MAELYGQKWKRTELSAYAGCLSQLAGVQIVELSDGFERGVRAAQMRSGSGLSFTVLLDRGMDIGPAEFKGVPLAWLSPQGFPHPSYYEPEGIGWLRTFGGGLVTGCGLTNVGSPSVDAGETLGQHGRLSTIPASRVQSGEDWDGNNCQIWVQGQMRQARLFAENILLTRRVSVQLGGSAISIRDTVENQADAPTPFMELYHINIGFPMLSEHSYLEAVDHPVKPRDAVAEPGLANWMRFQKPTPAYQEQVYYHDLPAGPDGWAQIAMVNPELKLRLTVRFEKAGLPNLIEWKQMGSGAYVLGFEPANCFVEGRSVDRARGNLRFLQPGEQAHLAVDIQITEL